MLQEAPDTVRARARRLAESLGGDLEGASAHVRETRSVVGGGSVPGGDVPSWGVEVRCSNPASFAERLRSGSPSVFCRTESGTLLFDLRTVRDEEVHDLTRAIWYALEGDERPED
jgi:L-seryl-tRNA(Ser) seleniumtransferase